MIVIKPKEKFIMGTGIYMWDIKGGKPQLSHLGILTPPEPSKKKRLKKATNGNN